MSNHILSVFIPLQLHAGTSEHSSLASPKSSGKPQEKGKEESCSCSAFLVPLQNLCMFENTPENPFFWSLRYRC